ncbi:MAG: hypothetical protein U0L77_00710 [Prevotellamassilia sp.]|nr:hypothetical protein [Prevotellamassilia sp.]
MIQALWIDDEDAKSFMDLAYYKGINITKKENVDDGIEELLRDSAKYDAIILDANCICNQDNTKGPDIDALQYATQKLAQKNIELPWFVYSGGGFEGENFIDVIVRGSRLSYNPEHKWYKKPKDMNLLFEDIKHVVAEYPDFKLKEKHAALFSWYPRKEELLNIIRYLDKEDNREDYEVFNKIRQELEFLMDLAHKKGFLDIEFKTTNLAACSQRLGDTRLTGIIPNYIQRSLHSAVSICNRGSHNTLLTDIVKENQAPYLIKSTIYEFLNLVHWFNKTEEEINAMKEQIRSALATDASELTEEEQIKVADKYQNKEYVVQKDQNNNYYCEECLLPYQKTDPYIVGKTVIIENIKRNTSKTARLYPYFATFKTKEADENTSD